MSTNKLCLMRELEAAGICWCDQRQELDGNTHTHTHTEARGSNQTVSDSAVEK